MITNRNVIFNTGLVEEAKAHAQAEFPKESCGAIIDEKYVAFKNYADEDEKAFMIKDDKFDQAYIDGHVQCVIHSHNNYPMASVDDQQQQIQLDIPFGIINLVNQSVTHVVFWGEQLPMEPLEGRHFIFGVWDCFELIRDWCKINLKVIGPRPIREWLFWLKGEQLFEGFNKKGTMPFDYVELEDIKAGDILFYNIEGTRYINHISVMLDNGLTLHHLANEISRTIPMNIHRENLSKAIRYNPNWKGWDTCEGNWRKI